MNYAEKLKDPRWQKKRLEILNRDNFTCQYCEDNKSTLHVHHEMYMSKDPWETPNECLNTVCEDCHSFFHNEYKKLTGLEKYLFRCLIDRDGAEGFSSKKDSIRNYLENPNCYETLI